MVSVTTLCNFNKIVFVYFGKIERSGFDSWPETVLCFWAKHLTLTVRLSTQLYKWVPMTLMLGVTLQWTSIPSRRAGGGGGGGGKKCS